MTHDQADKIIELLSSLSNQITVVNGMLGFVAGTLLSWTFRPWRNSR